MPKVTVLLATRNCKEFLRGCLDSLIKQTIIDSTEIIVIDNSSTGEEKKIVSEYKKRKAPIKYIHTGKRGLYHAWNLGIRSSGGRYITNLNSDDRLFPHGLEIMAKALDANKDVVLVYGDTYLVTRPQSVFKNNIERKYRWRLPPYSRAELLIRCICGPHPMWRRAVHKKAGYFDETYKIEGDYEFWLRIAEQYEMLHIPRILGIFYKNPHGLTFSSLELAKQEDLKIKRKYLNSK